MNFKLMAPHLKLAIIFGGISFLLLLAIFIFLLPARESVRSEFTSIGLAPHDDIGSGMKSLYDKIDLAINKDTSTRYNLFDSVDTRKLRMLIDSIQFSLTTGFRFNISEVESEKYKGFELKKFKVTGRSSFLGLSGFISAIEKYPYFMRFSTADIKYYGVLENSVSFVEYELLLVVPLAPEGFYLPPATWEADSLFEQIDIFLPFISNLQNLSEDGTIDLAEYELRSVKKEEATFQHLRFNTKKILKIGDEVKHGIIKEITENSVKVLFLNRNEVDLVEIKVVE
ncbi:hypothetical protein MASR1M107_03890 [Ignavibacteriales bacterium]